MKILFAGDLSFEHFKEYMGDQEAEKIFTEVKPLFENADYRMVNLESVFNENFAPIIKSGPNISSCPEFVHVLNYLKVDVAGLANNHVGDFGQEAMEYTWDILRENGIAYVGAGRNIDDAYNAYVFSKNGVNVSVIAICENEFGIATTTESGAAGYRLGMTAHRIAQEKAKDNYVVIFFHGGNENDPYPSPKKQELYRMFIEFGADAVVAMHTHCPQGFEIYNGRPIIYSMGNFYFPHGNDGELGNPNFSWYYGYLTQLEFIDGCVKVELTPYYFTEDKLEVLRGKRLDKFKQYMESLNAPIGDEEELRRLFKGWCMITGPIYAELTRYEDAMVDNQNKVRHMKNSFSCEAHNELLTEYLNLCYELKTGEVKVYTKRLSELQTIILD